ncbi:uncharacterized protein KNAG_0B02530 [Huiozyma naganishii CBS 8797]|uniref:Uncharacterized protein n=1 Tax=Huiozyma naganishii (strain ATCC MYA-139 / BCRC 22969 / CBS 8797 / KCTC 17520 / NBRC 10181 / NCYC 3082 / Yp74L-3) TaxID=1071383 RepID=J7R1K2_HUIN7|nr:hypothetical protein KNAG_0B02530 [Kazachstania naganishii CBS 8797]CCK68695.1 hypothetical protein KNAG_0B02530 [Kazachstania naganishii CBS 8797]
MFPFFPSYNTQKVQQVNKTNKYLFNNLVTQRVTGAYKRYLHGGRRPPVRETASAARPRGGNGASGPPHVNGAASPTAQMHTAGKKLGAEKKSGGEKSQGHRAAEAGSGTVRENLKEIDLKLGRAAAEGIEKTEDATRSTAETIKKTILKGTEETGDAVREGAQKTKKSVKENAKKVEDTAKKHTR